MTPGITDGTDEGQESFLITTRTASCHYQPEAGGFSSICDRDGVDWINFHPGEAVFPDGAAGVYRGLPNLVHPDGIGHPGFTGCLSTHQSDKARVCIETESKEGGWGWKVEFFDEYAKLSVEKAPPGRRYWFLYEGTPGGVYEPRRSFWGFPTGRLSFSDVPPEKLAAAHPFPGEKWVYFGHEDSPRVFFCARLDGGKEDSVLYFLGADERGIDAPDGMVVFGFGRGAEVSSLLTGPRELIFGFAESTDHPEIAGIVKDRIANA